MRVWVFEDNLMWSSRLVQTLRGLGHEPLLQTTIPNGAANAPIAIVNLGSQRLGPGTLVPRLKELGVHVIGHAGHKEKDLLALGKETGCDTLATNSELTFKIESLLERIQESLDSNPKIV